MSDTVSHHVRSHLLNRAWGKVEDSMTASVRALVSDRAGRPVVALVWDQIQNPVWNHFFQMVWSKRS